MSSISFAALLARFDGADGSERLEEFQGESHLHHHAIALEYDILDLSPVPRKGPAMRATIVLAIISLSLLSLPGVSFASWSLEYGDLGPNGSVWTVHVSGNNVYVGGSFEGAGCCASRGISRWDGTAWHPLVTGVDDGGVRAITTVGSDIYVGGSFEYIGGVLSSGIARWDGASWYTMGSGFTHSGYPGTVWAIAFYNNTLYAAGSFDNSGGTSLSNLAQWNGFKWIDVSGGSTSGIQAMAVAGGLLYIGGNFPAAPLSKNIIAFNGTTIFGLATGVNSLVSAIAPYGGGVVLGGHFTDAGGIPANYIARWNGGAWGSFGDGFDKRVSGVTVFDGSLYAGGQFQQSGATPLARFARWNGSAWEETANQFQSGGIECLDSSADALYAVGGFGPTPTGTRLGTACKWDNVEWSPLGSSGIVGTLYGITLDDTGNVYVSGDFGSAGEVFANNVAVQRDAAWSPLGNGTDGIVQDVHWDNNSVYIAGFFNTAGDSTANHVAAWDGISWHPLDTGTNAPALSVTTWNGDVYFGGHFTSAGQLNANYIASWDGNSWSAVGQGPNNGLNGVVYATASDDWGLYAGGDFTMAGGGDS